MTPVFSNQQACFVLYSSAMKWLGTPFSANGDTIGLGVSCQKLAGALYEACGIQASDIPSVPMSHARFQSASLVEEYMHGRRDFHALDRDAWPYTGDLLGFKIHHAIHHVGVVIQPGMFVHACEGCGVIYSSTQDATWSKRLARIWRPIWVKA